MACMQLDSVVNWLRRNAVNPKDLNEPTVSSLSKLAGIPLSEKLGRPNHKIAEDAVNWLRNNDPQNPDVDDDVMEALAKLAGIPMPERTNVEQKKAVAEDAMDT